MRPPELLDQATTPDGTPMILLRHGADLVVMVGNVPLMGSRTSGSEQEMARITCKDLRIGARVLVGGLGMGFTLRAALDVLEPDARVVVAELMPALIAWNRGPLGPLAKHPLDDPRVSVVQGDVLALLRTSRASFDVILLDVDNGPEALTFAGNDRIYAEAGLELVRAALRPDGVVAFWSAFEAPRFLRRLQEVGFVAEAVPVRARGPGGGGSRHVLYLGRLRPRRGR